jgi:hypothetical protein
MTQADDPHLSPSPSSSALTADVALADGLHSQICANPECAGRGSHERYTGPVFSDVIAGLRSLGWTPPQAGSAEDQTVAAPGGAVVVSVKPSSRLEPKVLAATAWALLAPVLASVAMWVVENPSALNALQIPPWARAGVLTLAGAVGALLGGYRAKHDTSRVRVTPVGDAAETQVIPLGPTPVAARDAEATGEFALRAYRDQAG